MFNTDRNITKKITGIFDRDQEENAKEMKEIVKVAFISGSTGQDGFYLTKLLLSKGYIVHGLIRRSSSINTHRLDPLYKDRHENDVRLFLHYGDISDSSCLERLLRKIQPDEVYNLAAMSHVRVSFDSPEYTANIDAVGALRLLEACRNIDKKIRFYQAGTSELYGGVYTKAQNEDTPFNPRSPYAVAKLYAHWITKNYRESYNMFCCNGVLFNHTSVPGFTPIVFKVDNKIDIKPINEIIKYHTCNDIINENIEKYQEGPVCTDLQIWDNSKWEFVTYASGYPNSIKGDKPRYIISKKSAYMTTQDHVIIMNNDSEKECKHVSIGDNICLVDIPANVKHYEVTLVEAELLGMIAGDGSINTEKGRKMTFANKDIKYINHVIDLWSQIGAQYNENTWTSIYTAKTNVMSVRFNGFGDWIDMYNIYTDDKKKRVPIEILNSSKNIQLEFLKGYNKADGLKKNRCIYEFKNFKTNSAVLAQGLIYLLVNTTNQNYNINVEIGKKGEIYYSINILSNSDYSSEQSIEKYNTIQTLLNKGVSQRQISRDTGISRNFIRKVQNGYIPSGKHHLAIECDNTVKKIIEFPDYNGWFYDLTTTSGKFHCGVGQGRIHNSPHRGHTFVEQKIVQGAVAIKQGKQECMYLGNIYSSRDFGHAEDYTRAMWLMLQQDNPDDYVIASGCAYIIKDIVNKVFDMLGMELEWEGKGVDEVGKVEGQIVIRIDPEYFRPSEVDALLGDSTKAREKLGWKPQYDIDDILNDMVLHEIKKYE